MTDVDQLVSEAERARAEAEAAAQRATELQEQAETARRQAEEEREGRRRAWAQGIVDGYDAEIAAADAAIHEAGERFAAVVASDLPSATEAYIAWAEAGIRHYVLQVRLAAVAPVLGLEATEPSRIAPPPFSQAVDAALDRRVAESSERARDAAAAEIARELDDPPAPLN